MTANNWRVSSYSHGNGACVALAGTLDRMRDTKNPGPQLHANVTALISAVKANRFNR
jgi:hypothetical protein